jgi:hypothetical protein
MYNETLIKHKESNASNNHIVGSIVFQFVTIIIIVSKVEIAFKGLKMSLFFKADEGFGISMANLCKLAFCPS